MAPRVAGLVAAMAQTTRRVSGAVGDAVRNGVHQATLAGLAAVAGVRLRARTSRGRVLLGVLAVVLVGVPTAGGFAVAALVGGGGRSGPPIRVAKIGLVVPLSGDLAEVGADVRNSVQLAVEEANEAEAVPGWTLELAVYDDLSRPDGGAAAASSLASDDAVVGVVGPLSSTVATVALPTLNDAGIAVVSPSNSRPDLTGYGDDPRRRPYGTYFRLVGTDDLQTRAAADYLVNTLGRPRVAVVDSGPDYGDNLGRRFAAHLQALGGQAVSFYPVAGSEGELSKIVSDLRADAPDAVYVDTGPEFAGQLRDRIAEELPSVPVVGSDALLGTRYLDAVDTMTAAEGDLATEVGAPLSELPGGGAFVAAYAKRWFAPLPEKSDLATTEAATSATATSTTEAATSATEAPASQPPASQPPATLGASAPGQTPSSVPSALPTPPSLSPPAPSPTESRSVAERWTSEELPSVAAYSYDAARALIRAAGVVLPGRTAVDEAARSAMVGAVARGSFVGVTGEVAFDQWGDPVASVATVYIVLGDRFVPLKLVKE